MLRRILIGGGVLVLAVCAVGVALYQFNSAPVVAVVPPAEAVNPTRPYVVKLHANWCPVCLATKDEWNQLAADYKDKVNLVVFDSTSEASIAASMGEATRLGLGTLLEQYQGASGALLVIDSRERKVQAELGGIQPLSHYRAAIDAALVARPL